MANPAPFVGTTQYPNGSSRPGANLYTDSMVALSARTGKLLWYHQAFPHDLYDRDQVQAMLVPVARSVDGSRLGGGQHGERRLRARAQPRDRPPPVEDGGGDPPKRGLARLTGPTTILPGTYGGVLTPPASAGGVVYAAALNAPDHAGA